jgi:hypothetical protein
VSGVELFFWGWGVENLKNLRSLKDTSGKLKEGLRTLQEQPLILDNIN